MNLPVWLPCSVKAMAELLGYGDQVSVRLLTDARMQRVWEKLKREPIRDDALKSFRHDHPIEFLEFPDQEIALALVYSLTVGEAHNSFYGTSSLIEKSVAEWRYHATLCRSINSVDYAASRDPELAAALERTARHFESLADWLKCSSGPRFLGYGHNSASGHEAIIRAQVAALIAKCDLLFESKLRTPLATIASVALDRTIEAKSIENWRQLMTS